MSRKFWVEFQREFGQVLPRYSIAYHLISASHLTSNGLRQGDKAKVARQDRLIFFPEPQEVLKHLRFRTLKTVHPLVDF
ncbi:uncharacterized protein Bfra_012341 [Botrytis fragariae]|uniref:Uncharacterized protein n=1 Tax=Botrytis fragariae TaxID=1964551 RepID=A0A8H6AJH3_9HELO|nr:uncharacterized protein Bfra_012341 [Botrytis fragariae]KAF5868431.1 hypothetical protein Bfra_012341 [Botrytis fragariae]